MLLIVWLILIIVPEGLGIYLGRDLSRFFLISFPLMAFLNSQLKGEKFHIPVKISLLWTFFLLLSFFSTIKSTNFAISLEWLFFHLSLFFSFLYFYNHKNLIPTILQIGIVCSLIFSVYTLFIYSGFFLFGFSFVPLPNDGYQFIYSKFGSHNHLGDWLVIFIIPVCFYISKNKFVIGYILGLLFFGLIIGSYSRSAYISLSVTLLVLAYWKRKIFSRTRLKIIICGIIALIGLSFVVVKEVQNLPLIGGVHNFIKINANLTDKDITARRFGFFDQAIHGIISKPYFGYGPGNFFEVSTLYTTYGTRTQSAHNIIFDTASELGIPATLIFLSIIGLLVWNQFKYPTIISLMIAAFLINSLTDYTYRIYSFMFLFIVLAGLSYQEKGIVMKSLQSWILGLICGFITFYTLIVL